MANKTNSAAAVNVVGSAVLDMAAPSTSSASEKEQESVIKSDGEETSLEATNSDSSADANQNKKELTKVEQMLLEMEVRNNKRDRKKLISAFCQKPNVHLIRGLRILDANPIIKKDEDDEPLDFVYHRVRFLVDRDIIGNVPKKDEYGSNIVDENLNLVYEIGFTNNFILTAINVHACMLRCSDELSNITASQFRRNMECISDFYNNGTIDIAIVELKEGDEYKSPFASETAEPYKVEREMVIIEPLCIKMGKLGADNRIHELRMKASNAVQNVDSASKLSALQAVDRVNPITDVPY